MVIPGILGSGVDGPHNIFQYSRRSSSQLVNLFLSQPIFRLFTSIFFYPIVNTVFRLSFKYLFSIPVNPNLFK